MIGELKIRTVDGIRKALAERGWELHTHGSTWWGHYGEHHIYYSFDEDDSWSLSVNHGPYVQWCDGDSESEFVDEFLSAEWQGSHVSKALDIQ